MEMPIDMQHQAMGYDRAATMFSPEGHLLQVEYAEKTVRLGSSSIGIVCSDGVFILADRRVEDKLITQKSANKIYEIDEHIIASVAGIISDARILIEKSVALRYEKNITIYDSLYLSLAKLFNIQLITADKKLMGKVKVMGNIVFLSDYVSF